MHKKPIEYDLPHPDRAMRAKGHLILGGFGCALLWPLDQNLDRLGARQTPLRKLIWNLPDRRDQKRSFSPPVIGSSGESRPAVKDMSPLGSTGSSVSIAGNGAIAVLPVPTGGAYGFENLMPPRLPLLEAELATVATFACARAGFDWMERFCASATATVQTTPTTIKQRRFTTSTRTTPISTR